MDNASQFAQQESSNPPRSKVMKSKCGEDIRKTLLLDCPSHRDLVTLVMRLYKLNFSASMVLKYKDEGELRSVVAGPNLPRFQRTTC